jgi:hypothetical protein
MRATESSGRPVMTILASDRHARMRSILLSSRRRDFLRFEQVDEIIPDIRDQDSRSLMQLTRQMIPQSRRVNGWQLTEPDCTRLDV